MILLNNEPRILLPLRRSEWRAPSQRLSVYGIENQTRFRITARLHDGHRAWVGFFDDRDDADAFLWAIVTGTIQHDRSLWDYPTETWMPGIGYSNAGWRPDIGEQLSYEFATVTFLTSPTGSNQTYTSPSDWNNASNTIETIAGGGGGSPANTATTAGAGAGAGGYSKISNFTFASPGTTTATYQIGAGGSSGASGGDTWFNAATIGSSSVGSKAGTAGSGNTAGAGTTTGAVGTTKSAGGNGGGGANVNNAAGAGGGAGGPNGAGGGGGSPPGADAGGAGGAGQEWDSTHGSGGGGGGGSGQGSGGTTGGAGGAGGGYGGAGGGGGYGPSANAVGGAGSQGIITITYTPASAGGFNMPMMGL